MNNKLNHFITSLKEEFGLYLSISFGIFLFVLFFQPFPFKIPDPNNGLVFIAGLATIVMLLIILIRTVLYGDIVKRSNNSQDSLLVKYFEGLLLIALNSVAIAFYLRFVGKVEITFPVMFRIIVISSIPSLALWINDDFKSLKEENIFLTNEVNRQKIKILDFENDYQHQTIEFFSEGGKENLQLSVSEVVYIQSANNYIEIAYMEGEQLKKQLVRNTLKNVEQQIRPYANFIRCHRICIVNINFISKLNKNLHRYWISIKGDEIRLPVSRQYLIPLKEKLV